MLSKRLWALTLLGAIVPGESADTRDQERGVTKLWQQNSISAAWDSMISA
jgi:hypothetical protein